MTNAYVLKCFSKSFLQQTDTWWCDVIQISNRIKGHPGPRPQWFSENMAHSSASLPPSLILSLTLRIKQGPHAYSKIKIQQDKHTGLNSLKKGAYTYHFFIIIINNSCNNNTKTYSSPPFTVDLKLKQPKRTRLNRVSASHLNKTQF